MHFSIPETELFTSEETSYTVFRIYINGVYHCAARYSELNSFYEQLKTEYGSKISLPSFPPKKMFFLTENQLDQRRCQLEKFIQDISQDPVIGVSLTFNEFLRKAQQDSCNVASENISLVIWLMNKKKVSIEITNIAQTEDVMEKFANEIGLAEDLTYYFGLFLMTNSSKHGVTMVRKLQDFESPFLSLQEANKLQDHWICVRKSFWDPALEDELLSDEIASNLLYVQCVEDIKNGWCLPNDGQKDQLRLLQSKSNRRDFIKFARTLKGYNQIPFQHCICNYPKPNTLVDIQAGPCELVFYSLQDKAATDVKESTFRVIRIRCWKITSTKGTPGNALENQQELAFEYLVEKDILRWIKVVSNEAILLSMCLQSMVDELLLKKELRRIKAPSDRRRLKRDPQLITKSSIWVRDETSALSRMSERLFKGNRERQCDDNDRNSFSATTHIGDDDL